MNARFFAGICLFLITSIASANFDGERSIVVSVPEQRLIVLDHGIPIAQYPVSTSRFGIGDRPGSYATPLGKLEIAQKIGNEAPIGGVFKSRHFTGEILHPNARGRDPIVTRILWLKGLENSNRNAYGRGIYIHGTPVERMIGRPASYGCIRMRSRDVVHVFETVGVGTKIEIRNARISRIYSQLASERRTSWAS